MKSEVKKALNEIRPYLKADGGDIKLVSVNKKTGVVKVKLQGACYGCPMAQVTLKQGVEVHLKENVPGVKKVQAVD